MTDVAGTEDIRRLEDKINTAMGRLDTELAAISQHHGDAQWQKYQQDLVDLKTELQTQIEALRSAVPNADHIARKSDLDEIRATLSALQEQLAEGPEDPEESDPSPPPVTVVTVPPPLAEDPPPPEPKKGYDWI